MANDRAFEIVVFGATGFTGGLVAEYLARRGEPLRWALAGRDPNKLERVRERLPNSSSPPSILVADASDGHALAQLAKQTHVVLTTVGPYVRYGEPLVRACAENGTNYVDLTGEPPFVERVRRRYHELAAERRVKLVNACGFDSIPHDLGAYFTLLSLRRCMTEEERKTLPVSIEGVVRAGGTISGGTWHSALEIMGSMRQMEKPTRAPTSDGRKVGPLPVRIRYRKELGLYTVPMPTIDPLVVLESARLLPEYGPDFRYGHFMGLKHWYQVSGLLAGVGTVASLAQFGPTRKLLGKLRTPGEGPSEEARQRGWFRVAFEARAGKHSTRCEVRGGDPGYGETAKMISESALCLAHDRDRLPEHYGVVPSAAAFGETLIRRLTRAGIAFAEVSRQAPEQTRAESNHV